MRSFDKDFRTQSTTGNFVQVMILIAYFMAIALKFLLLDLTDNKVNVKVNNCILPHTMIL